MKFPQLLKVLALALVISTGALTQHTFAQAQDAAADTQPVSVGSLIIPMDNTNQAGGTVAFNLRAYGLANAMLQANIPIKWAIKFNKSKDAVDFTATGATRIAGTHGPATCTVGSPCNFSGGPFIIAPEYATLAQGVITTFNSSTSASNDVTVFQVTTATSADIRYTLTHKPLIAVGPDGGNFGTGVDQSLFDEAGIPNYTSVTDASMQATSCYTLAVQAHSTSTQWVSSYRNFTQNGGNLLLQCASINTFENNATSGRFQQKGSYSVYGTNDNTEVDTGGGSVVYPHGFMPFNQFVGALNGDQDGAITDYFTASSNFQNGNLVAAAHSGGTPHNGSNANAYIATVSDLSAGLAGGHVFELGGHDYDRGDGDSDLGNLNGKRMILNTIFVPVTRPTSCGLSVPSVEGYKSVAVGATGVNGDVNGNGQLDPGDTVIWTVTYINRGLAAAVNFQITDVIPTTPAPGFTLNGSIAVTTTGAGTVAIANPTYNGAGNNNLLAPGAILPLNGKITITIPTKLGITAPSGTWQNQTHSSGFNVSGDVKSDDIDAAHPVTYSGGNITPPSNSIVQIITPTVDPTVVSIFKTTAADATVNGRVITAGGTAISRAQITVVDAQTSEAKVGTTNLFGYFTVEGLEVGKLYIISVSHPSYQFTQSSQSFVLNDNVSGLVFVATTGGKGTRSQPGTPSRQVPGQAGAASAAPVGKVVSTRVSPF